MYKKLLTMSLVPPIFQKYIARIEVSPIGYRLAKGAFWSLFGALLSKGLGLLSFILVARMLGKVGFGELGIIQSTVGMFGVFAGFGLGLTSTKYVAEFRKKDPAKAGRIMALSGLVALCSGGVMAIALIIFSPWLAANTIAAPHLKGLLQIGSGMLFLSALNGAQTGALAGFEAFKTIALVNIIAGISAFPLMVGGAYLFGVQGTVWGLVASGAVNWLLNHFALRIEAHNASVPFILKNCVNEWKVLQSFSLPAVLAGAMTGPVHWACSAMLVNQPDGYAGMGVYNAVMRIKQVPEMILTIIMAPLLPVLSEQFGKNATISYNKTISYAFTVSILLVIPISLIQITVPTITLLPYGPEYQGNYSVVRWMMVHAVLVGLFYPFGSIITSMNRMWFGMVYNLLWGAVYLLAGYLLIPSHGIVGLAAAAFCAQLTTSILCVIYIYRYERPFIAGVPLFFFTSTMLLLSLFAVVASVLSFPPFSVVIGILLAIICGLLVYKRIYCV